LVKPFSKQELLARIRALGRRIAETYENEEIKLGNINFNPLTCEIESNENIIKLTSRESQILEVLIKNKNLVILKEQLFEKIWGFQSDVELNTIDVYISYLRKKLSKLSCKIIIKTIRNRGYCLKEED
jgi:DNA-binding response OmpR family regulator